MLQIQGNMLNGSIPTVIGSKFPNIQMLSFGANQFTGPIPTSLSNLTSLQILVLDGNSLSGYVPRTLGRLHALQRLILLPPSPFLRRAMIFYFSTYVGRATSKREKRISSAVENRRMGPCSL